MFNMFDCKYVSLPIANYFKLTFDSYPKTQDELERMTKIFYANAIGSVMYLMICARLH